jgi:murein DD-endopeptidase MepM/ murein hydrolase activator NlpD
LDEASSPGRYRGRRRAPAPPLNRYAAVVTSAVVGAGVVALGSGAAFSDAKLDYNNLSASGDLSAALEDRAEAVERASRAERGSDGIATSIADAPNIWLLPTTDYYVSSTFGYRFDGFHGGTDLAGDCGTPIYAAHAGTVSVARYYGGYGLAVVIQHDNGVETLYGHSSEVFVTEGQRVEAGERIAAVGNTGYSFGCHLHFEVHIDGVEVDPIAFMADRGVDIPNETDPLYSGS